MIVIGCPGSGKSTFSIKLSKLTKIPLYHLDLLNWNEDGINVKKSILLDRLEEILNMDSWIIDGNYGSSMEKRIIEADTIIFLDYPTTICLEGIRNRKGKKDLIYLGLSRRIILTRNLMSLLKILIRKVSLKF